MRAADRAAVADLIRHELTPVQGYLAKMMAEVARLGNDLAEVKPVSVELDRALADRIAEKMHGPLTIPQPFSDWIRDQAQYREIMRIDPLGYGPAPGTVRYVLKPDGSLYIEFQDCNGATQWQGTFHPPERQPS